jgi:hypothetical protein
VQSDYAVPTLIFVALTLLSILGDWLRHRRMGRGRPGWIPWPLLTIVGLIGAIFLAAFWLRDGG